MTGKIEINSTAYTKRGRKVFLDAVTTTGGFVVTGVNNAVYGEDVYEERGETWIERELFEKPPVAAFDEDITRRLAQIEELRAKYVELTSSVANAEKECKERLAKLAKFDGLENLEAFIEGRVTHVVIEEWSDFKAVPIDILQYHEDSAWSRKTAPNGVKLVTLFGNSNGNLQWRVNEYKDGSGSSWKRIEPCMSLEEAEAKRAKWALEALEERRCYISEPNKRHDIIASAVAKARECGAVIPDDLQAIADQFVEASRAANLAKIQAEIEERNQKLAQLSGAA